MRKRVPSGVIAPGRRSPDGRSERVMLGVRVLPSQKEFLSRLGGGSLSIGFDRALAAAAEAGLRS